jgi:hypothetical protein
LANAIGGEYQEIAEGSHCLFIERPTVIADSITRIVDAATPTTDSFR